MSSQTAKPTSTKPKTPSSSYIGWIWRSDQEAEKLGLPKQNPIDIARDPEGSVKGRMVWGIVTDEDERKDVIRRNNEKKDRAKSGSSNTIGNSMKSSTSPKSLKAGKKEEVEEDGLYICLPPYKKGGKDLY